MSWLEAVVLGLVQGLTEFLPISSSAHLRIVAALFGWDDPGAAFTAVTQIGTETAVIIYFWRDIIRIIGAWFRSLTKPEWRQNPDARMGWLVIVGTLPIGILGLLLEDQIDHAFRDLRITATTLIAFGLLLGFADYMGKQRRRLTELTVRDGLIYGFAQALALIPGVSRSGGTTTAGLLMGYTREAAARYSFLLAIPAVLASGFFKLLDIGGDSGPAWAPTIAATVIAFVVAYGVIAWFMNYISTRSFMPFVGYRIGLGLLIFFLVWFGLDPAAGPVGS
ncbi:MAG: undecaprenyl-diphosphate phosphatase [Streptosporangiales bacterium]|nr:undecaprenyl-diphosphate phosphatase [Streptosporangiales bacterium]